MFTDTTALAILAGAGLVAALGTWFTTWAVGAALARRSQLLAGFVCSLLMPVLTIIIGVVLFRIDSARYPLSDGPPMALLGWLTLAMMMVVVTIPIAWLGLRPKTTR